MANVPESPNFEAIIRAGVGNGFFAFAMPQANSIYFEPAARLVADVGQNQAFIEPAVHLLLRSETNGPYQGSFELLTREVNGSVQGNFDLLQNEAAIADASLSMLRETLMVVIGSVETVKGDDLLDPPPSVARTPKSGGSFCGF